MKYTEMQPLSRLQEKKKTQILVIGGGPSGVCAAVTAARMGSDVALIEQAGTCGGMATQGLVGPFMTCYDRSGSKMILRGIFEEVINRLVACDGALHPSNIRCGTGYTSWIVVGHDHVTPFEPEALKRVFDEMLTEAKVKLLYHTLFLEPLMDCNKVRGAVIASKSGIEAIEADIVIDCTGDGDVAARAGVPFENGNEVLHTMQPATMFFRIGGVDSKKLYQEIEAHKGDFYRKDGVNYRSLHWRVAEARANGDWTLDRVSIGIFQGVKPDEWNINTSRIMGIDSTNTESLTEGEIEGRRQVDEIFRFLRKYVPGCENAHLLCSGSTLGIRESRHICGERTLTLDDIVNGKTPDDSVLVCSNSADIHGRSGPKSNEYIVIRDGNWYGVPYGCMVPQKIDGLLVAGRCLSATSDAAGAVRVIPPCMCMGQAVGVAAALAIHHNREPRSVLPEDIREHLRQQGAFLPDSERCCSLEERGNQLHL